MSEHEVPRLNGRGLDVSIRELKTGAGFLRDFKLRVGRVSADDWTEPMGPTPFPTIATLREWDRCLLSRYKPFYMPFCDLCCLCTYGKCDLTGGKHGACGITMPAQQSRMVLIAACIGAATHASHARRLLSRLTDTFGPDRPLDISPELGVEAPITRLVCGIRPKRIGDFEEVLHYVEDQLTGLLSATHTGQEGDPTDIESKVFQAGMLDHLALEAADIVQISCFGFPKADPSASLIPMGMGSVNQEKPVILVIGHDVPPAAAIVDYLSSAGLDEKAEVTGICCTAIDLSRYSSKTKIIGPISWQLRYIRSGIPDVIVVDEQCIRTDVVAEASRLMTPVIATSEKNCCGLADRTRDPPELVAKDLASGRSPGALILDPTVAGEVAVRTAFLVSPIRKKTKNTIYSGAIVAIAADCTGCLQCRKSCPNDLPIPAAMKSAGNGDIGPLEALGGPCVGCARCEYACPAGIPIHDLIGKAQRKESLPSFAMRTGRGAIQDTEIRKVGGPIVLGEIPGVVAFVGCANFPDGSEEVARMCIEFARRRYIVCTSGCSAMAIGMYRNEEGKTPYEMFSGGFEAGGVVNVGSCVSNAHIAGAAIKIASIFARRPLRGNYAEVADYVYNRVGAVGVAWGAMSQKAAAIAAGFWRLGIPVVVGPQGTKYRRMLLGNPDLDDNWKVTDARTGKEVYVGPVPEHLFIAAESIDEAKVLVAKLCMRPNDTTRGRALKLTHYIDLHKRLFGSFPEDVYRFIRVRGDVPITMKTEIEAQMTVHEWREGLIPDPTIRISPGKGGFP